MKCNHVMEHVYPDGDITLVIRLTDEEYYNKKFKYTLMRYVLRTFKTIWSKDAKRTFMDGHSTIGIELRAREYDNSSYHVMYNCPLGIYKGDSIGEEIDITDIRMIPPLVEKLKVLQKLQRM